MVEEPFAAIAGDACRGAPRDPREAAPLADRLVALGSTWREIGAFREALRDERYDAVVDTQSLLKSALISGLRAWRAPRHGRRQRARSARRALLRASSCRAACAACGRSETGSLSRRGARATRSPDRSDYGIEAAPAEDGGSALCGVPQHDEPRRQALAGGASWIELGRALGDACRACPGEASWSARARRASRMALPQAKVPPRMTRRAAGAALRTLARRGLGVDTGLTHLAAAVGVRTVGIYCGSDPALTGIYGASRRRTSAASARRLRRPKCCARCCEAPLHAGCGGCAALCCSLRLWWRGRPSPRYREEIGERFGFYGDRPALVALWIHAVSVGEARAAAAAGAGAGRRIRPTTASSSPAPPRAAARR